jgi:hypothetical protein
MCNHGHDRGTDREAADNPRPDRPDRGVQAESRGLIQGVTRICVERADDQTDPALEIESGDGTGTILRVRVAALPDTVDGIVRQSVMPSR